MKNWRRLFVSAGMFTATGLLVRAAVLAAAYGVAHAAGWRAYTSILCGTAPGGNPKDLLAVACGVVYVALHFAWVLGVPVLVIAGLLLGVAERWGGRPR